MRPRPSLGTIAVTVAFLWVSTAVAAVAFWPLYRSWALVIAIAAAMLGATAVGVAGAVLRWASPIVLLATAGVFLLVGVPVAVPSRTQAGVLPTLQGLADLVTGVALGWRQLLTITLPVGDYQALLVPPFALVLTTTALALGLALRTRVGELAVLAPVAVFVVAVAFGPQVPERPVAVPVALLGVVLAWLSWFRWHRRRSAIRLLARQSSSTDAAGADAAAAGARTVVGAALIVALAAGGAAVAAVAVPPTADRTVLRTTVVQPFDPRDFVSPLSGFRGYWQPDETQRVLFTVSGLPDGARLRLATMDTYGGVVYSVGSDRVTSESGSFVRVPTALDQSGVDGESVSLQVTVGDYRGVWLPTAGAFESVRFGGPDAEALRDRLFVNDVSGTAAVIGGIGPGDVYTLDAVLPSQPGADEIADFEPGGAVVPSPADPPEQLTAALESATRGLDTPGERLAAALAALAEEGYISHGVGDDEPPSRSGHALDRIAELFDQPRMIGDGEQYAVAAALMADQLGFPARVVLGFDPDGGTVRADDVLAWIEVDTARDGWVAIDPNPPVRDIPEELPEETTQVSRPQTVVPPPVVDDVPLDRQQTPDGEQDLPPQPDPLLQALLTVARVAGVGLLVLAIVLAPFALVVAAKARRRRLRRRRDDPRRRIAGGWNEFEDAVLDHGLHPSPSSTRTEVAAVAGTPQAQVLASVADRASFAPDQPASTEADAVWRAVDDLRRGLDRDRSRWQRLRARISLRSFRSTTVTTLFKR